MVDIESQIFTALASEIRKKFKGAMVSGEYVAAPSKFPYVSIVEQDNYISSENLDSSDAEQLASVLYEVNVYSNKTAAKKTECRKIMDLVDRMLYSMNFTRISMHPVPNMENATIYRLVARYTAKTDGKTIYRR